MNKTQKALLAVVMVCAIAVAVVLFSGYRSDRKVLSGLKKDLEESTATWKRIKRGEKRAPRSGTDLFRRRGTRSRTGAGNC